MSDIIIAGIFMMGMLAALGGLDIILDWDVRRQTKKRQACPWK